jgi:TRAP-type transport system small permease protein
VNAYLDRFQRLLEISVAVLFIALFLATMLNIVLRNLGGIAWMWIPGFTRIAFIWLVFLGIAIAYRRSDHLEIDFFLMLLPKPKRNWLLLAIHCVMLPFFAILFYYGIEVARARMGVPFPAWRVPTGYAYIAVPASAVLLIIFGLERVVKHLKEIRSS